MDAGELSRCKREAESGTKRQAKRDVHSRSLAKCALGTMTAAQHAGSSKGKNSKSDPEPLADVNFLASLYMFPPLRI